MCTSELRWDGVVGGFNHIGHSLKTHLAGPFWLVAEVRPIWLVAEVRPKVLLGQAGATIAGLVVCTPLQLAHVQGEKEEGGSQKRG